MTDVIIFHFGPFFAFLQPLTALKNHNLKKMKKTKRMPRDIIILPKCTKNHDHILYCFWDMASDRCNCYFLFWATFCPFTPPNSPKNQNFTKMKNTPGDIIILHMCTKNYDQMMYGPWDMVHNRQMDKWKKWHIEVSAPLNKK